MTRRDFQDLDEVVVQGDVCGWWQSEAADRTVKCPLPHFHRSFGVPFAEFASEEALNFARRIRQTLASDCDGNSPCTASFLRSRHHHRTPLFDPATLGVSPVPTKATVVGQRQFYRSDQEWIDIVEQLNQTRCPHCHACGTLNRHGVLTGFGDTNDGNPQRTLRARRILCSKRRQSQPGCGRTFSIWLAHKIRRFSLSTHTLLTFLQHLPEQNTPRTRYRDEREGISLITRVITWDF